MNDCRCYYGIAISGGVFFNLILSLVRYQKRVIEGLVYVGDFLEASNLLFRMAKLYLVCKVACQVMGKSGR